MDNFSRRNFIKTSACLASGAMLKRLLPFNSLGAMWLNAEVPLSGHLWIYASEFPPDWDCTPILDQVFTELSEAGLQGVEVMESILRHDDVVSRMSGLIDKYNLPVTGTSYYADMWDGSKQQEIVEDVELIAERLHALGGSTFGITVGDAGRVKTEPELDDQADTVKKVIEICEKNQIQANLHNHMFEVENNMHDLKGTLKRVPDAKLGPDLGWLKRAGVDPVWFIEKYGHKMVYMHIRDLNANGKWTKVVGQGEIDWPGVIKALRSVGFEGRAAIELEFEKTPARRTDLTTYWKKSRKYVKEVFGW